mmetsp:Transcript_14269/g.47997  ORF Transcript_14269/g.47997 Transcript_14269/m.47997 type:complete len:220 (+) Transcript_14269:452-1111(+)
MLRRSPSCPAFCSRRQALAPCLQTSRRPSPLAATAPPPPPTPKQRSRAARAERRRRRVREAAARQAGCSPSRRAMATGRARALAGQTAAATRLPALWHTAPLVTGGSTSPGCGLRRGAVRPGRRRVAEASGAEGRAGEGLTLWSGRASSSLSEGRLWSPSRCSHSCAKRWSGQGDAAPTRDRSSLSWSSSSARSSSRRRGRGRRARGWRRSPRRWRTGG